MNESLSQNYARGGFGKSLSFGTRPALLVIDFVQAYLDRESPLYAGVEQARADCVRLLLAGAQASPWSTPTLSSSKAVATVACSSARCRRSPASKSAHTPTWRASPMASSRRPARR